MTCVIMSSAYVDNELQNEFGRLPPSFLPLGRNRVYDIQIPAFDESAPIVMTLPDDYVVAELDRARIENYGAVIRRVSSRLSVVAALDEILSQIDLSSPVRLLFGDSLVTFGAADIHRTDVVAVADAGTNYEWTYVDDNGRYVEPRELGLDHPSSAVCGYFSFGSPTTLKQCIADGMGVADLLNAYTQAIGLENVRPTAWLDFGHLSNYFRAKKDLLVTRYFNKIEVVGDRLTKMSDDRCKMSAEVAWYRNVPTDMQLHLPRFLGEPDPGESFGYALEYLYLPSLSDLHVFGDLPVAIWRRILRSTATLIAIMRATTPAQGAPEAAADFSNFFFQTIYVDKTHQRLAYFLRDRKLASDTCFTINGQHFPPLGDVADVAIAALPLPQPSDIALWHGDLFFSNMLYDSRSERVMVVDPRGLVGTRPSVYGGLLYDLGKLAHSIIGKYDVVAAGRYDIRYTGETTYDVDVAPCAHAEAIADLFEELLLAPFGATRREATAVCTLLFLSMLPLHNESPERQDALLANGLAMYRELAPS